MTSDSGDYIGQGQTWSYTPATGRIAASASRTYAGFGVDGADGSDWSGSFTPGDGDILAAGSSYQATRYPFNGSGAGMDISKVNGIPVSGHVGSGQRSEPLTHEAL